MTRFNHSHLSRDHVCRRGQERRRASVTSMPFRASHPERSSAASERVNEWTSEVSCQMMRWHLRYLSLGGRRCADRLAIWHGFSIAYLELQWVENCTNAWSWMCIWNGPNRLFMKRERVCAYLCETLSVFCMCSGIFRSRRRCQCERGTPLLRPSRMWHVICGRNLPIMSAVGSQSSFLLRGSNKEAVTKGWGEGRGRGEGRR